MLNKIKKQICPKPKRSQEEMVGFALIIIIVAVILLIFIGFSLRDQEKEVVESYEVDSFIQSFLQYTTDCVDSYKPRYRSIEKLIIDCNNGERCLDERDICEVLDSILKEIIEESWDVKGDRPVKGYNLKIGSNNETILDISDGDATNNYKSSMQELGKQDIEVIFKAYY